MDVRIIVSAICHNDVARRDDLLLRQKKALLVTGTHGKTTVTSLLASALSEGPQRVRDLRKNVPDAGKILLHNVYGWFARAERGVYILTDAGRAALKRWPQQVELARAPEAASG